MNSDSVTSTLLTPDQRAEYVLDWWTLAEPAVALRSALARGIRDAENAALDRAAEALTAHPYAPTKIGTLLASISRPDAVRAVLALKHPKAKP